MEIREMIKKHRIDVVLQNGQEMIKVFNPPKKQKEINEIKAAKAEIIAEIKKIVAEKLAAKEEAKRQQELQRNNIITGKSLIKPNYYDGEYLQGYAVHGIEAEELEKIGAAKHVSGWGYLVDYRLIEALSKEFSYLDAVEYMKPANELKETKKAEAKAERQAKFDEAAITGQPVVLQSYATDCNDPKEECSTDIVTVYAMPDGTTKTTRQHTW